MNGDEVIVASGDYPVSTEIASTQSLNVHGPATGSRPRLLSTVSKARVRAKVRFAPASGSPQTESKKLTLVRRR